MLTHFPRPVLVIALLAAFAVGIGVGVGAFTGGGGSSADSAGGSEATEAASSPFGPGPTTSTTSTTTTVAPRAATIAFTGDLLPHSPVVAAAAANAEGGGWDFRPMFDEVRPIISAADLAICHLESPLSLDDTGLSGYPVFNAPKALGEAAADAGYDGCSTASNHAYDRGAEGVESTVQALEAVGLPQAGMALTAEADPLPTLYDVNGISVAHISATYGLNGFELPADQPYLVDLIDPASILAEAAAARSGGADFVIVSLHWGEEYRSEPTEDQLAVLGQIAPSSDILRPIRLR